MIPSTSQHLLRRALPTLRVELADAATRGRVATSADVAAVIAGSDPVDPAAPAGSPAAAGAVDAEDAAWVDAVLEAVTRSCAERGEPDLASLVHRGAADELDAERRRCWRHWGGEAAESAGLALALR